MTRDSNRSLVYRTEDNAVKVAAHRDPLAAAAIGTWDARRSMFPTLGVKAAVKSHKAAASLRLNRFVSALCVDDAWRSLGGPAGLAVVSVTSTKGSSSGGRFTNGLGIRVNEFACLYVVVHELAHVLVEKRGFHYGRGDRHDPGHGPLWRAAYVALLHVTFGDEVGSTMHEHFLAAGLPCRTDAWPVEPDAVGRLRRQLEAMQEPAVTLAERLPI